MHPFRLVALGGAGISVLAMLLPFASFPVVGSVDGIAADAWPALIPILLVVIVSISGRWDLGLEPVAGIIALLGATAALVFSLVKVTDSVIAVRDTAGATVGPGGFVLAVSALVITAAVTAGTLVRT